MNQLQSPATVAACELAGEIVRTFGEVRLRVFGTSMVPAILPGDLISVQRAGVREIPHGAIILYAREGRLFAHRVVGREIGSEQALLVARGDRLDHNDPPVCSAELLGRVTSIERGDGRGGRRLESPRQGLRPLITRALRGSDRATYLYVRLNALWQSLFPGRTTCPV